MTRKRKNAMQLSLERLLRLNLPKSRRAPLEPDRTNCRKEEAETGTETEALLRLETTALTEADFK
jgi:hypothetical protein